MRLMGSTFLILVLISLFLIPILSSATTIYVPKDETTIEGAITRASDGDTIQLIEGLYYENLVIRKNVTIVGPQFLPVDQGKSDFKSINVIQLPPYSFGRENTSYFPFEHAAIIIPHTGPAIDIESTSVSLKNLFIFSVDSCIQARNSSNITIEGCFFNSCDNGFNSIGGNSYQITQNMFESPNKAAIKLENIINVEILNNTFKKGRMGIDVKNAQQITIGDNLFFKTEIGVNSIGFSDALIRNNEIVNGTFGILLLSARNVTVIGNDVQNVTQYVLFFNSADNTVYVEEDCKIGVLFKDLQSSNHYIFSDYTFTGKNFLFSCLPGRSYSGFRYFGNQIDTTLYSLRPGEKSWINLEATTVPQLIDDIDPFSFGFYSTNDNIPVLTGRTYVTGNSVRASALVNDTPFGVYALLGKRKMPFGLTIEGITFIFLIIAALIALMIYRQRHKFAK